MRKIEGAWLIFSGREATGNTKWTDLIEIYGVTRKSRRTTRKHGDGGKITRIDRSLRVSPGKIGELLDKLVKHQRKWRNHQGNEETRIPWRSLRGSIFFGQ